MKFNTVKNKKQRIKNYEYATAYKMSPEMELYTSVVTSSLSPTFYEGEQKRVKRIRYLIKTVKPMFVAKLAVYAREQMYLRSIPLVLVAELAKVHSGDDLISRLTTRVIQRADEITELLAYYQHANGRWETKKLNRLSKQIQKGIAAAFNKFDGYQFAKYNRKTDITFKDALFLTHPKAKDEAQQALFNKIVGGDLEAPYTWEVELSVLGQQKFNTEKSRQKAIKAKWEELIASGRLGYMALMRNLRNILQAGVNTKAIRTVANRLADKDEVRKSRQLPFRYLAAFRELEKLQLDHVSIILDALEKAIQHSAKNISGFGWDTRVLLAADVSGSMFQPISQKSKIRCYDVGLVLSMLMRYKSKFVTTGIFGDSWKEKNLPAKQILTNVQKLDTIQGQVGYSTNAYIVIEELIKRQRKVDKVLFFTDLQLWDSRNGGSSLEKSWKAYKKKIAPRAKLYLFDLTGYGNTPVDLKSDDVYMIAGWSDKIFDVLSAIENGKNAIQRIKKVQV